MVKISNIRSYILGLKNHGRSFRCLGGSVIFKIYLFGTIMFGPTFRKKILIIYGVYIKLLTTLITDLLIADSKYLLGVLK